MLFFLTYFLVLFFPMFLQPEEVQKCYCTIWKSSCWGTCLYSVTTNRPLVGNCRQSCTTSSPHPERNPSTRSLLLWLWRWGDLAQQFFCLQFLECCNHSGVRRSRGFSCYNDIIISPKPCQHLLLEKSNATEIIKHEDKFIFNEILQLFKGWIWFDNFTVYATVVHTGSHRTATSIRIVSRNGWMVGTWAWVQSHHWQHK